VAGPYCFDITANEIAFPDDILGVIHSVFLAVEEVTKDVYAGVAAVTPENAAAFFGHLVAEFPQRIFAVTTDIGPTFTDPSATFDDDMAAVSPHPFAVVCRANRIFQTRTGPPYPKPFEPRNRSQAVEIR